MPATITNPEMSNTASNSRPPRAAFIDSLSVRSAMSRSVPGGRSTEVTPRFSTVTS